jgi:hypothetical protein
MSQHSALSDIDPACQDDKTAWRDFAARDDAIARRVGFELTEPPEPTDLRRLQHREHLIASRFDQRMYRLWHGFPRGQACDKRTGYPTTIDELQPCSIWALGREPLIPADCGMSS